MPGRQRVAEEAGEIGDGVAAVEASGFRGPEGDLGPDGAENLVAMAGEEDVEIEEGLGQVGVGAAGDVEGLGELAAGVVGDERGEDGDGPVAGRDAKLCKGGRQDVLAARAAGDSRS